mgnify:CR=1 FL=1
MSTKNKMIGMVIADRYCITSSIGAGGMGMVYSAIPFDDPAQNVAIKVILRDRKLSYDDLLRFQKEAALMSRLHHPNIISFYELGLMESGKGADSGGYYIVMEVAQGDDLKTVLKNRQSLEFFFQLGLQVSSALEYTHSKNIIHRDIKPQNIMVGGTSDSDDQSEEILVKVLDFGVARLAEINQFEGARDIAGTPTYMAPETSEHLNAPVDHRSDLYALGCVLYEALAGKPPFSGGSRDKLAREHAYNKPEPLMVIRPEIPSYIDDIVQKLLAKHPDDRYQTAFGLHVDLQRARRSVERKSQFFSESKTLGRYDGLRIMTGSLDLIGREEEFQELIGNYSEIAKGRSRSRLSVIHGGAGSGKSRLLGEFRSYLARHKIRYVSTSFSRHENNLPFNALANGLNEYLIKVLKTQQLEAEEIRAKVREVLGSTATLVAKVVPGLKPYIFDDSDEVNVASPDDFEGDFDFPSFAKAFSDFTRCLTSADQPIVFIFDDMHWADEKSIELVDSFFSHNNSQRFFLIVTYSEDLSQDQEHFHKFIKKFEKLRRRYSEIELEPLTQQSVSDLSQLMLNTEQSLESDFIAYLQSQTKGNPLFLVELVRNLVTSDLIRLDESTGRWEYETREIKNSKVLLDSIDLTLNRILDYDAVDQGVLEVASVVGTSFHFEMLMIDAGTQSITVMRALQKAISDYLIVRTEGVDELKYLGKSFSFSHHRIREAIKDTIPAERLMELHLKIALKLQRLLPNPATQTIFTLAHHFNQALGDMSQQDSNQSLDSDTVVLAFKYNVMAGEKAFSIMALVSAQRYYSNALNLFPLIKNKESLSIKKFVLSQLGDIYGLEKKYTKASERYIELLNYRPGRQEFASVSYKLVYFGMLNGRAQESLGRLYMVLNQLGLPTVRPGLKPLIGLYAKALTIYLFRENSSLLKKLKVLSISMATHRKSKKEPFHAVKLYQLGQSISLTFDRNRGLAFHWQALKMGLSGKSTPDAFLRTLGDFGITMGYLGFRRAAYHLIDEAIKLTKGHSLHRTYSYLLAMRTLTLDHFQNRSDDYDAHMEEVVQLAGVDHSQQLLVQSLLFRMHRSLMKGETENLNVLVKKLPNFLRTRHWLSPRGVSMHLFCLLLQDARTQVIYHKGFLKRRNEVNATKDDVFHLMIESMVFFAMGDLKKSYTAFLASLERYCRYEKGFFFPYEDDFILLFLVFFPSLLSQEQERVEWDEKKFKDHMRILRRKVKHRTFSSRPIPLLVAARIEELFRGKNIKYMYDKALKSAKLSGETLAELIVQYWFGRHLLRNNNLHRKEYIYKLHADAKKIGYHFLENMAISALEEYKLIVPGTKKSVEGETVANQYQFSAISKESIHLVSDALDGVLSPIETLNRSLKLLRMHFRFEAVHIVLNEHVKFSKMAPFSSVKYSEKENHELVDYVSSYISVRSTLFIPEGDAPWNQSEQDDLPEESSLDQNDQTVALTVGDDEKIEESTLVLSGTASKESEVRNGSKRKKDSSTKLNTLVPIKDRGQNLGVALLEKTELNKGNSAQNRLDLDYFGAYLGLWLNFDSLVKNKKIPTHYRYSPGNAYIEPSSWLDIWSEGAMRGGRESGWYLGLKLSDDEYLVVYCRLNGIEEIREDIAKRLWYHLLAARNIFQSQGKRVVPWEDVYDEVAKVLLSTSRVRRLDTISISFSILSNANKQVISGHFGPSRPAVLGQPSEVTPKDRAVLSMQNSRVLRFWHVASQLDESSVYLSAHDSNKLFEVEVESLVTDKFFELGLERKKHAFLSYLNHVLAEGQVPRYFVAATLKDEVANFRQLGKAE